jgi:hypothetical protein
MTITPENYWPLGSTVQKTITSLADTDHYRHFGLISVNPVNGHAALIYRKGETHVGPGDYGIICIRHSLNGGTTWEEEEILFDDSGNLKDLRNVAGGYDSNGRLFVFYTRYDPDTTPPTYINICYNYSDNDGLNWSKEQTLDVQSNPIFSAYGHIVDVGNKTLYQTWHGGALQGSLTYYRIYLYKSTDGGDTFLPDDIIVVNNTPQPWGEASMVNVGGGCFLLLARKNEKDPCEYNHYIQFKSEDNCTTWEEQGTTEFEDPPLNPEGNYAAPPFLSFINYEGVGIVACYFTNRCELPYPTLKVIFGLAKDLLEPNGYEKWNEYTEKLVYEYSSGTKLSGYQSFFQPLNQYKGIGVCFHEIVVNQTAYPVIVFTKINEMTDVLIALGF